MSGAKFVGASSDKLRARDEGEVEAAVVVVVVI